jgi:hypothetical protein
MFIQHSRVQLDEVGSMRSAVSQYARQRLPCPRCMITLLIEKTAMPGARF